MRERGQRDVVEQVEASPSNSLGRPVVLAYAGEPPSAGDMQWIVRLVGWWLLLTNASELLGHQIANLILKQGMLSRPFGEWRENIGLLLLAAAGGGLIILHRWGFWLLLGTLAVWPLVPGSLEPAAWLCGIPWFFPSAVARMALVLLIYHRARVRGVLRPGRIEAPLAAQDGEDLIWFTRIVGWYFVTGALYRLNCVLLSLVLGNGNPFEIWSGDTWLASATAVAVSLVLGWRPALLVLACLPTLQLVNSGGSLINYAMKNPWVYGRVAGDVGSYLVSAAAIIALYRKQRRYSALRPARVPQIGTRRQWITALVCVGLAYCVAVAVASFKYEIHCFITGEKPLMVRTSLTALPKNSGYAGIAYSIKNNTPAVLTVDLSHAELVAVGENGEEWTDAVLNAGARGQGVMKLDPGSSTESRTSMPINTAHQLKRLEIRGASYRLGNGAPTTLPAGSGR